MYCKIKKLSGFTIYYLHNSDECRKCRNAIKSDLDIDRSRQKFGDERKIPSNESLSDGYKPLRELVVGAQKVLKAEFELPTPHGSLAKISSKHNKVLKKTSNKTSKAIKALPLKCKKESSKPVKNVSKPAKKKTAVKGSTKLNSVKACSSDKKVNGSKLPGKGTLKRKRWLLNKLNDKNNDYEDDLFENQKFEHFQTLLEDETDGSEKYDELQTPVFPFSLSPGQRSPSPTYRDCYSPTQLSIYRKGAEEYQYRRKKRTKLNVKETQKDETPQAKPLCREEDIQRRLEEVVRILKEHKSQNENSSDSEDDQYFSDLLDNSFEVNP